MSTISTHSPWQSYVVDPPRAKVTPKPATYAVVVEHGLRIPMRDGVELAAMLWRPDTEGPFPTLVERGPHQMEDRTGPAGDYYAARGYAVLSVGLRGCSGSDGEFSGVIPGATLGDGYDVIEWVATQPWCDGQVGMICGSISGFTQYQTAVEAPPHLGSLLVREGFFSTDIDDAGGMFGLMIRQFVAAAWTEQQLEHTAPERRAQSQALVDAWRQQWQDAGESADANTPFVPVIDMLRRLPLYPNPAFVGAADYYNDWVLPPDQANWFEDADLASRVHQTQIPICHLGGWFDPLVPHALTAFESMQAQAATPEARSAQRLIVGPWLHGPAETNSNAVGLLEFGPNADLDFFAFRQRWYDAHLRGEGDLSDDPVVWLYLTGPDCWLGFESWPPPITPTGWYLHADGLVDHAPDDDQKPGRYEYDPADPVRTLAGGGGMSIGVDQRPNEHRLLCYTSPVLSEPLTLVGPLKTVLHAASSAPDTDWIVRLTLVRPDGASVILAGGALRARFRHALDQAVLLEAGKLERFEIEMTPLSIEVPSGSRLRLTVTSSDFPAFARNLNTGGPIGREREGQVAVNTVYHDESHPSHVILPVLTARGLEG